MSEIEKVFSKYGDTVGRVYLTLFYSYSSATFELQKINDNRGIADYNNLFNQYVQNNYGVEFFHLYEQFAKENEANLQLRNELKERHTEFINIAVFESVVTIVLMINLCDIKSLLMGMVYN